MRRRAGPGGEYLLGDGDEGPRERRRRYRVVGNSDLGIAWRRAEHPAHDTRSGETRHALRHESHPVADRNEAEKSVQVPGFLHRPRFEAVVSADRHEQIVVSGRVGPREQEKSLTSKGRERERSASCEAVTFRERDDQRFAH